MVVSMATRLCRTLRETSNRWSIAVRSRARHNSVMASIFVAANLAPAAVGQALKDVDTPACVVDLDAVEANIRTAIEMVAKSSPAVRLRPHVKSHKCAELALLQTEIARERMIGVCCQKVVEAEAMLAAGIRDVLVSNQIVGPSKLARLAALTAVPGARIGVLVDDAGNLRDISAAMARSCAEAGEGAASAAAGAAIDIYVEVDVGQRRCGVSTTAEVLQLAQLAARLPGTRFAGIQCYQGAAQHVRTVAAREDIIAGVAARAAEVRDALVAAGVPCPVVTGGGSGTFWMEAGSGVFTEVQPGSFIFNDADYARNLDASGQETWVSPWLPSLFLLSTVMSRHAPAPTPAAASASGATVAAGAGAGSSVAADGGWVVLDSGLKAQSTDSGLPVVVCDASEYRLRECEGTAASAAADATEARAAAALPGVLPLRTVAPSAQQGVFDSSVGHLLVKGVSDEHSTLIPRCSPTSAPAPESAAAAASSYLPALGSKLMLMPGHCDPFVNHYDWVVAVRGSKGGAVVGVWRLGSRSPGS